MTSTNRRSSHLVISIKYQYLIGIAILFTSWVGSLIAFWILIPWIHLFTNPTLVITVIINTIFLVYKYKRAIWSICKCFWKPQLLTRFSFSQKPKWNSSPSAYRAALLGVLHFQGKVCPKSTMNHSLNHKHTFGGFKCMMVINSVGFGYGLGAFQHLIVIHNGIFRVCIWGLQMHDNDT